MRVWGAGLRRNPGLRNRRLRRSVAAVLNGLSQRRAVVMLKGGNLEIEWSEEDNHCLHDRPAVTVF